MFIILCILIGLVAGVVGGALGLGGGAVMVPAMILLFGLTQHQAQGTALAVMMIPVFIPAVLRYYSAGNVKVQMAVFIAVGFIIGALAGAHYVQSLPEQTLRKLFGAFVILIGLKMMVK
ncbi:MAG TPA: sulfite exporter TauE/SafE family protein [Candidatus Omnitrophota bacterium]|nr:sulfite exporter TauE/SafE family protein [Candidatus Omnitrophota bacterium]